MGNFVETTEPETLEVVVLGAGRPLVVLHGSPQDPHDLNETCFFLAKHAEVHRVAMPGYGETSGAGFDWDGANETLRRYVDTLERPILFGVSGGAYRALALATSGASLAGVMCVAGFAHLEPEMAEGFSLSASALERGVDLSEPIVGLWFSDAFAADNPDYCRGVVHSCLNAASPATVAADVRSLAAARDLRYELRALDMPVRILVGELDAATPKVLSEAIHAAARNSELEVIEGAGHLVHHEARDRVFEWSAQTIAGLS